MLLQLVDGTSASQVEDFRVIDAELAAYGAGLREKPRLVGLNKIDAMEAEAVEAAAEALEAQTGGRVFRLSGVTGRGVTEVLRALAAQVAAAGERAAEGEAWRP